MDHKQYDTQLRSGTGESSEAPENARAALPPLAQKILDLSHQLLPSLEGYYTSPMNRNRALLREQTAAITLSQQGEIMLLHQRGEIDDFLSFYARQKGYNRALVKKRYSGIVSLEDLIDEDGRVLRHLVDAFEQWLVGLPEQKEPGFVASFTPAQAPLHSTSQRHKKIEEKPPSFVSEKPQAAPPAPKLVVADRMRTEEEWRHARELLAADIMMLLDQMIGGKLGQDLRWARAVHEDVFALDTPCSIRYREMADDTWGLIVEWREKTWTIFDEYERLTFLNTVKRTLLQEKQALLAAQNRERFIWWQKKRSLREEARLKHTSLSKEEPGYETPHS